MSRTTFGSRLKLRASRSQMLDKSREAGRRSDCKIGDIARASIESQGGAGISAGVRSQPSTADGVHVFTRNQISSER